MGCGASVPLLPLRKLDPAKFTKVFEKEKVTEIAWLTNEKCLLLTEEKVVEEGAPTREEDPFYKPPTRATVEVYDVKSKEVAKLSSVIFKDGFPCLAASDDGSMYSVGAGNQAYIFNADGSEISKMKPYSTDYSMITKMTFSPDGKNIAVASDNGSKGLVVMSVDGAEVFTHQIDGNYKFKVGLRWWDNQTVMVLSTSCAAFCDISSKTVSGKWSGPPKGVKEFGYTHDMNPEGIRVMKSGKVFLSHRDDGTLFLLKERGGEEKFQVLETFTLHDKVFGLDCGHKFVVLADEQTLIYERPKGDNNTDPLPDQFVSHVAGASEKLVLPRGEEEKLSKVEIIELNSSETILATVDKEGAKLYSLGDVEGSTAALAVSAP